MAWQEFGSFTTVAERKMLQWSPELKEVNEDAMSSSVEQWVDEVSRFTHPDNVVWCDGSKTERDALREALVAIHEFYCGCDTPGLLDFCICEPREPFKILGRPE